MNKEIYRDNFMTIIIDTEKNIGYYADVLYFYVEMPINIAEYIVKKIKLNLADGYRLIGSYSKVHNYKIATIGNSLYYDTENNL